MIAMGCPCRLTDNENSGTCTSAYVSQNSTGIYTHMQLSIHTLITPGGYVYICYIIIVYRNGPNVPYMQYKMFTFIKLQ